MEAKRSNRLCLKRTVPACFYLSQKLTSKCAHCPCRTPFLKTSVVTLYLLVCGQIRVQSYSHPKTRSEHLYIQPGHHNIFMYWFIHSAYKLNLLFQNFEQHFSCLYMMKNFILIYIQDSLEMVLLLMIILIQCDSVINYLSPAIIGL